MTDALELFRAMRPNAPQGSDADIRQASATPPVSTVGGSRDLHQLAMVPGSAAYRARIPRPPCYRCGEDHHPGFDYGHEWEAEPVQAVHDEPVSATAVTPRRPSIVDAEYQSATSRRVALYVGRNDTYVVAIEEAPDWDSVQSFKVEPPMVLPLVNMARALGAKIADKTGGDLLMLEQEMVHAGQYAQAHDRSAETAGDREPRRQGPAADRTEEDQPEAGPPEDGELPDGGDERRHPARRAQR